MLDAIEHDENVRAMEYFTYVEVLTLENKPDGHVDIFFSFFNPISTFQGYALCTRW